MRSRLSGHKPILSIDEVLRDCHLLFTVSFGYFALRNELSEYVDGWEHLSLLKNYDKYYSREVSTRLLNIAINCRILDDFLVAEGRGVFAKLWKSADLELIAHDDDGEDIPLREIFSKIIHATSIDYELMHMPDLYLSGSRRGSSWNVILYVIPFCVAVQEWIQDNQNEIEFLYKEI